jgi:hypothetical protein
MKAARTPGQQDLQACKIWTTSSRADSIATGTCRDSTSPSSTTTMYDLIQLVQAHP